MIPEDVEIFVKVVLVTALIPLLMLLLKVVFKKLKPQKLARQYNYGRQEAAAVVLKVELMNSPANRQANVKLQMQVLPDRGRNFVAEMQEQLDANELAELRTGASVKVKFNPANLKEIALIRNRE
jgi:hypothetical protein